MVDQKLVDELEKALTDEAYDGGMGALSGEEFSELVRTLAVTAAEVVEKAHTPTDDEREALWDAFDDMHRITEGGCDTRGDHVADMVLGLGFRRTEVPEPSRVAEMIEQSSFGTPEAQELRATVSDEKARALVDEANRRTEYGYVDFEHGLIPLMHGYEGITHERPVRYGPWVPVKQEGADDV